MIAMTTNSSTSVNPERRGFTGIPPIETRMFPSCVNTRLANKLPLKLVGCSNASESELYPLSGEPTTCSVALYCHCRLSLRESTHFRGELVKKSTWRHVFVSGKALAAGISGTCGRLKDRWLAPKPLTSIFSQARSERRHCFSRLPNPSSAVASQETRRGPLEPRRSCEPSRWRPHPRKAELPGVPQCFR